jgi:hypothetical protein
MQSLRRTGVKVPCQTNFPPVCLELDRDVQILNRLPREPDLVSLLNAPKGKVDL